MKRQAELSLSERDQMLMRRIDKLHLELPFYGSRKLADRLWREGHEVGRRHVATLMRRMGIEGGQGGPDIDRLGFSFDSVSIFLRI